MQTTPVKPPLREESIESRLRKFCGVPPSVQREAAAEIDRLRGIEVKYGELLYAVATKHPDETRHQTALRYIRDREMPRTGDARERSIVNGSYTGDPAP